MKEVFFKNIGILRFVSKIIFMLSWVEHEKSFTTPGPDHCLPIYLLISYNSQTDLVSKTFM